MKSALHAAVRCVSQSRVVPAQLKNNCGFDTRVVLSSHIDQLYVVSHWLVDSLCWASVNRDADLLMELSADCYAGT